MQLTMTAEIDLPDAPQGYEWRLTMADKASVSAWLVRVSDNRSLGIISEMVDSQTQPMSRWATINDATDRSFTVAPVREVAMCLLYELGLVTLGQVDDAIQGKVAA